jgi:energy-coupling factor transporter transmembrane protein EcfT
MVLGVVGLSRIRLREFLGGGFLIAAVFTFLMSLPATLNIFLDGQVMVPLLHLERAWGVGPYTLPPVIGLTREGAFTMATVLLRVLASVSAVLCLSLCTRWVDLLRALRSFRLPAIVLQVVGMTVRYLHAFHAQGEEMHLGKKSRSICRGSLSAEQAWVASRIANAWGHAVHLMTEVSEAMTARGFRGEARFPPGVRFGISEWVLCASTVLTCAGAHLL